MSAEIFFDHILADFFFDIFHNYLLIHGKTSLLSHYFLTFTILLFFMNCNFCVLHIMPMRKHKTQKKDIFQNLKKNMKIIFKQKNFNFCKIMKYDIYCDFYIEPNFYTFETFTITLNTFKNILAI
jgi:hypothetical protein